jgi:hypothetical protein
VLLVQSAHLFLKHVGEILRGVTGWILRHTILLLRIIRWNRRSARVGSLHFRASVGELAVKDLLFRDDHGARCGNSVFSHYCIAAANPGSIGSLAKADRARQRAAERARHAVKR